MNHTNQLIHESSPYLLQHAHNPVNWLPYGTEAFEKAKSENKPILISVGYSACHWCHVMERESFENQEIADLMNSCFVCVKVDREEHPDVDQVYMDAVHLIHASGGWPLNCFALPDGRPFWGGTYFTPVQWKQLLVNINELFRTRYSDIEKQATEISEGVIQQNVIITDGVDNQGDSIDFDQVFSILSNAFDDRKGGLKGAPKFPMPALLNFIFELGASLKTEKALNLVEVTLQNMARGGIYDQAGGGFSRYSTDSDWKVPHFEKMLYDNAQLVSLYARAYQVTRDKFHKTVIEHTIEFINRELKSPEGIFYSALDADSEGKEGLFYTWTEEEFNETLGHYAPLAAEYYGINAGGLWENGRNILIRPENDELFSQQHFLSSDELAALTGHCRNQLLKVRSERVRPGLDDKMLVAWNGLMISALVDAYTSLGKEEYLHSAINAAEFILKNLKRPGKGLYHTWKRGKAHIDAFLDDYAFISDSLLKLFSVTTDTRWLDETLLLVSFVVENFYDSNSGFFWYSAVGDKQVFARKLEIYDGVIPSGNSVMAKVLNKIGIFLHNKDYLEKTRNMVRNMESRLTRNPAAYANWASLALSVTQESYVVVVVGEGAIPVIRDLYAIPSIMIYGSLKESRMPYFENRYVAGKTLIYVCAGNHCFAPVENAEDAIQLLSREKAE